MGTRTITIALAVLAAAGGAMGRIEERRVGRGEIADFVRIERIERAGDTVRVHLANATAYRLENLRLVIGESFRWANEMHPGADDPSRAAVVTVREGMAPHGSLLVTHIFAPRPARADGWFETTATVLGLDYYPATTEPDLRW